MPWTIIAAVTLATAGLLVLGWFALAAFHEVRALARELDASARRISLAARGLEGAAESVARRAGDLTAVRSPSFIQDGSEPA
ncbi:hypothetical protein [Streptacidiphilus sp. EB129]|jgi:hypothetical protein|uniref:hypothetical protein n=1 Tax=Streptacidiphilus sp. EB129 TaxID=3156262 RepID=UPI0035145F16